MYHSQAAGKHCLSTLPCPSPSNGPAACPVLICRCCHFKEEEAWHATGGSSREQRSKNPEDQKKKMRIRAGCEWRLRVCVWGGVVVGEERVRMGQAGKP